MSNQSARTHYQKLASVYDRRWQHYIDKSLDLTLNDFSLNGDEDVLDVACGTGELEAKLLSRWPNLSITAVDMCPEMLDQALSKHFAHKVTWYTADATNLPSSDASFDVVLCSNAFHYFREPALALDEFRRVLRPNGLLRIVDWCDDYLMCKICSVWFRISNSPIYRTYSLQKCGEMIEASDFSLSRFERCRIEWLWGMMLVESQASSSAAKRP